MKSTNHRNHCIAFVLVFLFSSQIGFSQEEFRVISCSGQAEHYHQSDTSSTVIIPGNKILPQGTLVIKENCQIKLISNDKPLVIDEPGEYDLEALYQGSISQSMSFTGKFWKFVVDGLKQSDSKKDIKKYHQNYLAVSGGIKGYSEENDLIQINSPLTGKITPSDLKITWTSDIEDVFWIEILNAKDRSLVARVNTTGRDAMINAKTLESGKDYYIKVLTQDTISSEVKVSCITLDEENYNMKLESLVDYNTADALEKEWMKAVVLEIIEYPTEASIIYEQLLKEDQDNILIKKLYTLFLTRNNQLQRANQLINNTNQ